MIFHGYCAHYHPFDYASLEHVASFLPNSEIHLFNLGKYNISTNEQLFQLAIGHPFYLKPGVDKWQWFIFPTCGQYNNPVYGSPLLLCATRDYRQKDIANPRGSAGCAQNTKKREKACVLGVKGVETI